MVGSLVYAPVIVISHLWEQKIYTRNDRMVTTFVTAICYTYSVNYMVVARCHIIPLKRVTRLINCQSFCSNVPTSQAAEVVT